MDADTTHPTPQGNTTQPQPTRPSVRHKIQSRHPYLEGYLGTNNRLSIPIDGHITTNIPFACYQLYGRNLQTKSSLSPRTRALIHVWRLCPQAKGMFGPRHLLAQPHNPRDPARPGLRGGCGSRWARWRCRGNETKARQDHMDQDVVGLSTWSKSFVSFHEPCGLSQNNTSVVVKE